MSTSDSDQRQIELLIQRLESLTRLSSDWLWETDTEDRFTHVSVSLSEFLGIGVASIVGRRREEICSKPDQQGLVEARRCFNVRETFRGLRYELPLPSGTCHLEIAGEPQYIDGTFTGYRGITHDVTADLEQARALQKANRRLRDALESTPAGYVETDADNHIIRCNKAMCRLADRAQNALMGMEIHSLFPDLPEMLSEVGSEEIVHAEDYETRLLRADGKSLSVSLNASIEMDAEGEMEAMIGFVIDISARKEAEKGLEEFALRDPVTGLHNRGFVEMRLQTVLDTAARGECNAVMFVDLDRFKEVNDSLGHDAGDELLREIAQRLRSAMRPGDIVARFGGDEFVIIAHCQNGAASAERIAGKLCELIAQPVTLAEHEVSVGASIGVSLFPQHGEEAAVLFKKADAAMYTVKRSGRNGWQLHNAS